MIPFISRSSHNEIVELLKQRIADLEAERKKTLDYIFEQSLGRGLFAEVAKPVVLQEAPQASYMAPVNEARKHPRAALRELQAEVNRNAEVLTEAQRVVQETIQEGQESA